MRILAIGDPHGDLKKIKEIPVKDVDLILLTGDLGSSSLMRKIAFEDIERKKNGWSDKKRSRKDLKLAFMEAYNSTLAVINYLRKIDPVYTIFGNVESSNKETKKLSEEIGFRLPLLYNRLISLKNVNVLNNRVANFSGLRVGGLNYFYDVSWVKEFHPEDYPSCMYLAKKSTKKAKRILDWFEKLEVLVCHQPPFRILDRVTSKFAPPDWIGKHAGSKILLDYIKKKAPKYVFCGHIHEGKGMKKIGKTKIYNLGSCGWKIISINQI